MTFFRLLQRQSGSEATGAGDMAGAQGADALP